MSGETTRYCSRCLTTFPADADRCPNLGCRASRPASGWGELLNPGGLIDRTYRVHKMLAIGGAGVTYLAGEVAEDGTSEVGPRVAVKVLYAQRDQGTYLQRLQTEAQILQGLNHPQIVECRGFVHRSGHSPYLVTRYEPGGSLLDHVARNGVLPVRVVAGIGRQVCWALEVAHRQGVVHRDLKPENVLLEESCGPNEVPRVRVADFGIAKVYGAIGDRITRVGAFVGTPQYAAPEQFEGLAPEPATDVYAVGALLYFCLRARPVASFMAELEPGSQREHLLQSLPPRLGPDVLGTPEERRWMQEVLATAMEVDPGDRCDITALDALLAEIAAGRDPGPKIEARAAAPPPPPPLPASTRPNPTATISMAPARGRPDAAAAVTPKAAEPAGEIARPSPGNAGPAVRADAAPRAGRTPDPKPVAPSRSAHGIAESSTPALLGGGAILALLLGGGAILAAIAAFAWHLHTEPRDLTATETDASALQDWRGIAGWLGEAGVAAEKACNAQYLQVEVVVEGDGALRSANLLNYAWEPTRACIEQELRKQPVPRAGTGPVRVAVSLQR